MDTDSLLNYSVFGIARCCYEQIVVFTVSLLPFPPLNLRRSMPRNQNIIATAIVIFHFIKCVNNRMKDKQV